MSEARDILSALSSADDIAERYSRAIVERDRLAEEEAKHGHPPLPSFVRLEPTEALDRHMDYMWLLTELATWLPAKGLAGLSMQVAISISDLSDLPDIQPVSTPVEL